MENSAAVPVPAKAIPHSCGTLGESCLLSEPQLPTNPYVSNTCSSTPASLPHSRQKQLHETELPAAAGGTVREEQGHSQKEGLNQGRLPRGGGI